MKYSVIIPVYNEKEAMSPLYFSLRYVMEKLGQPYELIFVDDGSEDSGFDILGRIAKSPNVKKIRLVSHRGKSEALSSGFESSSGDIIITIDGDLQNDPEDIPKLLNKMIEGYDVVCGWRTKRKDNLSKKLSSYLGNLVRRVFLKEKIHDVGCELRVYKRAAIEKIKMSKDMHRFLTAMLLASGAKIGEVEVRHYPRLFGKSKYNIRNRLRSSVAGLFKVIFARKG